MTVFVKVQLFRTKDSETLQEWEYVNQSGKALAKKLKPLIGFEPTITREDITHMFTKGDKVLDDVHGLRMSNVKIR
jgi:hypothetical protein